MNENLTRLLRRAETWPEQAQSDLEQIVREIEAELNAGVYRAAPDELAGIDRGLGDAAAGRFATNHEVEAVFAKHRT